MLNLLTNQHNRMFVGSLHLAGVAVIVLTLGGFYALVYQPLQQKQAEHLGRTQQLDLLLVNTGSEGIEYRKLRKQLNGMKESVDELHRQLSDHPSATTWIGDIRDLAAEVGLEVLDTQMSPTESQLTHSRTEVEFHCLGSYASICRFLEKTEQLTKTTKLSKFELSAEGKSARYPIQLTFVLYSEGKSHDTKEKRGVL